jgi:hypothetical protein
MMTHRHLLPDEIDQLLDGEVGFGVAPLVAHVSECEECREALEEARVVVAELEALPRLAPDAVFAERVMSGVHVYVPWHAAAREAALATLRPLAPRSQPVRVLLGASALSVITIMTAGVVWLAGHLDAALFVANVQRTRVLQIVTAAGETLARTLFGPSTATALARGSSAVLFATVVMYALALLAAALVLRTVAVGRRRARSQ